MPSWSAAEAPRCSGSCRKSGMQPLTIMTAAIPPSRAQIHPGMSDHSVGGSSSSGRDRLDHVSLASDTGEVPAPGHQIPSPTSR